MYQNYFAGLVYILIQATKHIGTHKSVKRHVNSKGHLSATIKEKTFGTYRIEHSLDNHLKISHRLHNKRVQKNRDVLKRLTDVTCFLGSMN